MNVIFHREERSGKDFSVVWYKHTYTYILSCTVYTLVFTLDSSEWFSVCSIREKGVYLDVKA